MAEASEVRGSAAYRVGVWLVRVASLVLWPIVIWGVASVFGAVPSIPGPIVAALVLPAGIVLGVALVLFYRCGIRVESMSPGRVRLVPVGNSVYRDIFLPRR